MHLFHNLPTEYEKMSRPKRHHFVPASYLARFTKSDSGVLYVLDMEKNEIRKQKPKNVLFIKDYYRQEHAPEGVDENIFEKTLGILLEAKAKPAIDKLINDVRTLNEVDCAVLLSYLHFQRIRVPRQIEKYREFLKTFVESLAYSDPEIAKDLAEGRYEIEIKEEAKFKFMKDTGDLYTKAFARMIWKMSEAPKSTRLVTTDSPVSFVHPKFHLPLEADIDLIGTMVLYPLSSTHLLVLNHPELDSNPESNCMDKVPINDWETGGYLKVRSGRLLTDDQVEATNDVLAKLADRYVIADYESILKRLLEDIK